MENRPNNNNKRARDIGFYALILVVLVAIIFSLAGGSSATPKYSEVLEMFESKQVESFAIKGNRLVMELREPWEGQVRVVKTLRDVYQFNEDLGETIKRLSFQKLLEVTEIPPVPQHVIAPRANPYILFKEEEVPGGWTRDITAFRQRHSR